MNPVSNLRTLLKSLNEFLVKITNIDKDNTIPPEISDFFSYWNFMIWNYVNQGYADCGWIWTERWSSSAFKCFWTHPILLSTQMQGLEQLVGIAMAGEMAKTL